MKRLQLQRHWFANELEELHLYLIVVIQYVDNAQVAVVRKRFHVYLHIKDPDSESCEICGSLEILGG